MPNPESSPDTPHTKTHKIAMPNPKPKTPHDTIRVYFSSSVEGGTVDCLLECEGEPKEPFRLGECWNE